MNSKIKIGDIFEVSKTPDKFFDVEFSYDDGDKWIGALPINLRYQGFSIKESPDTIREWANVCYDYLSANSINEWDKKILKPALEKTAYGPDTTKVLNALQSGDWECRVCGPVPKVNAQPAARLRDLKQNGFCIGTKSMFCSVCNKKTYHDILIKIPVFNKSSVVQRFNISNTLRTKIYKTFNYKEACFYRKETPRNLIIDHKFPSDRWNEGETVNLNSMNEIEIRQKFQLLTNQTNMIKNRMCYSCVETNRRGTFMGISWFYQGDEFWRGKHKHDENGCIGCPWYDLEKWKIELQKTLNNKESL